MEKLSTTCDAFLGGRVHVLQPERGFRSGLDAVFLAAACPAKAGDSVLEAGCGAGAASLCLLARVSGIAVTGVEADAGLSSLSGENATANGFGQAFKAVMADVTAPWESLEAAGLKREAYDHVIANPPYYAHGRVRLSSDARNARSRSMGKAGLEAWLRFLAAAAKPGGTATVIHIAEALPELLDALHGRFGGLRLLPLFPKEGAPAIRIIVRGKKGSRAPLSLEPGIVLHGPDGAPTKPAESILRDRCGLFSHS
jgi:tRNA1(Val) A37 N6-methylase TrmN6